MTDPLTTRFDPAITPIWTRTPERRKSALQGHVYAFAAAFFGVAFFVTVFFGAAFFAAGFAVVFVTRPDLVLLSTVGFSTTAGACEEEWLDASRVLRWRELTALAAGTFFTTALALGAAFGLGAAATFGLGAALGLAAAFATFGFGAAGVAFLTVVAFLGFAAATFFSAATFGAALAAAGFGTFFASLVVPDGPAEC